MDRQTIIQQLDREFHDALIKLDTHETPFSKQVIEMETQLMQRRALAKGKVLPTFMKPFFLTSREIESFKSTVNIILGCQEKLIRLYFSHPEYRPLFELTETEIPLMHHGADRLRHIYFSRMDSIFPPDADFKFLEFNCDSPGGAYYSDIQWEVLRSTPVFKDLGSRHHFLYEPYRPKVLHALLNAWKDSGRSSQPNIAVMGDPGVTNVEEFRLFSELFCELGYASIFTDPWSCTYDGSSLRKGDFRIDLIYRRGILADYSKHTAEAKPVIDAIQDGAVVMANPFSAKLGDNKNLLEVMTDERMEWVFNAQELALLRKHLPWTRIIKERRTERCGREVDLIQEIRANRDQYVIKPNAEFGGKGVVIGRESNESSWDDAIHRALSSPHVVQEYVRIPEGQFPVVRNGKLEWEPKKINVNFFTFAGEFGGGFCRTSDSSIINISAGGALVSFCIVDSLE